MAKDSNSDKLGKKILAAIRSVLQHCENVGERIDYPGEGGERRFRAWLNSDLLQAVLRWPSNNVAVGERFDLLLLNADQQAVATIETKTPYHKASKKEKTDFEERLSGYPTLRTAYFTNGPEWERLDIVVSEGQLRIIARSRLNVSEVSPAAAEQFFAPLRFRPEDDTPTDGVYQVNRNDPFIASTLSRLAADLDDVVAEHTDLFQKMFRGLRGGQAGEQVQSITTAVYSQWCVESLRVTPHGAGQRIKEVIDEQGANARTIGRALSELGLDGPATSQTTEAIMSLPVARRTNEDELIACLWPAFDPSIDQLCAQTAHVILARTLLYRVGEDEAVFSRRLSGSQLGRTLESHTSAITGRKFPATEVLESVRVQMQGFLPTVYLRGEFDWWAVIPEQRPSLTGTQRAWLRGFDEELERLNKLMLRRLNQYEFESVDVDIWRNIYEHYLPEDERQRLGGFYTPDELVSFVLDMAGYVAEREGLCRLSYIDPACGSGAFVTIALARLLAHLDSDMSCHKEVAKKGGPEWRSAERKLCLIAERVHAIDVHPFASFLTTLNVLFIVLPLYVEARKKDPEFTIDLHVFSADALERPEKKTDEQMHIFAQMNSRIQLQADGYERYRRTINTRFDCVFGNPPWGGVLKGSLAPVYDDQKKKHFRKSYPSAAQGKYDIYGLFMERALQLLSIGGRFALVTQDTYLDKEWARLLRKLLAEKASLDVIIDFNPFGQLFFHAMNSPCVTVGEQVAGPADGDCLCITCHSAKDLLHGLHVEERKQKVLDTVREVFEKLMHKKKANLLFASGARVKREQLRTTANDRWDLSGTASAEALPGGWFTAADLLEMRQGVTPGGCLDLFLMQKKEADTLRLEKELVRVAIKSKDLERWHVEWNGQVLFYPYHWREEILEPAFTIPWKDVGDELKNRLIRLNLEDTLDFDKQIDEPELEIVREGGIKSESVLKLLKHRIGLELVKYPAAAEYLVRHYDRLEGRVFKKRNIRRFNRRWYEYLWPRDANVMLATPRILSPTLIREVRFVLDDTGYLSDHACLMIQPTEKTSTAWTNFADAMEGVLGQPSSKEDLLKYCVAFLNSGYAQARLVRGHRPTPKGSYAITEAYLREIPIPVPRDRRTAKTIIEKVGGLLKAEPDAIAGLERALEAAVQHALGPVGR